MLVALAGLSTWLHLQAESHGPRWQVYLFKPLTITLLLTLAMVSPPAAGRAYQLAISAGLACSLVGDVLLMLPHRRFAAGLASFFVAHLWYVAGLALGIPAGTAAFLLLPLAAAAFPLLWVLWPSLGRMRWPVLLYVAAILVMVWRAWARGMALASVGASLAAAGATLFIISDAILAVNQFHRPIRHAQVKIIATYELAQALIALSVGIP